MLRALRALAAAVVFSLLAVGAAAQDFQDIDQIPLPTSAVMMVFSPLARALVVKSSGSAIAVIDIRTRGSTTRLANTQFTDLCLSPSERFAFGADYGGENIGYGTPAAQSYVHRVDLLSKTWEVRMAYIAGNVQAVSDTQIILKSVDQWVTFTNNAWGSGPALAVLNTGNSGFGGPGYYASVFFGDFRYSAATGRLLHGNSGLSSQEIQAFRLVNNEFVKQEGSGTYGSAQGYGGTVVLANDGSAFYYGSLQVDPLDVAHNRRVFAENIYAANGHLAFGDGKYYSAQTGELLGSLPFSTTVYAVNPKGEDFWAYDAATTTAHHFASVAQAPSAIPTLSVWSSVILAVLLMGAGAFLVRYRA